VARDQKLDRFVVQQDLDPDAVARASAAFRTLFEGTGEAAGILEELVGYLPLAAIATDPDGIVTRAFGSALDRVGVGDDALVGAPVQDWGPEVADYREKLNGGQAHVFEIDGVIGDDIFRSRVFGVPDQEGGSFALVLDLSSALEAERAVDENRALLESVIDSANSWLLVQNEDGAVITANKPARDALGVEHGSTDPMAAIAALDPVHEDGSPFGADDLPTVVARRNHVVLRNVVMGLATGTGSDRRWMSVTAAPMQLEGRSTIVTSFVDIADLTPTVDLLRDSDERFRLLAEEAPIGIFIIDAVGELLYVNPAVEELAGRTAAEVRADGWEALTHPDDLQRLAEGDPLDILDVFTPVEYRIVRPDGSIRWVRSSGALVRDREDNVIGLVGTAADVTQLHEAADRLSESEARNRAIVETAAEGIVSVDESGLIVEFNAAAERIFDLDSDDVIGAAKIFDLFASDDSERLEGYFHEYLCGAEPRLVGKGATEVTGQRRDRSHVPIEVAVTEFETAGGRLFTALIRDLSQHKAYERELEHLATHDPLTGLPNRALFTAQLESALLRADRLRTAVAVLFVDIDRVKLVTEALGHRAGDDLIVQAANRVAATAGPIATVGRFASDQVIVLLEDQDDVGDSVDAAVRIIEAINEPFMIGADEAFVNASVGIAFAKEGLGGAETLISNADVAMGRAKSSSVSRYEVFDSDMRARVEAHRKTEIALRHGIEREEFELYYQPVVRLETNEVVGYEALVRWNHPSLGTLTPADFMPLAEESGLIVPLGEWILRDAIHQSATWAAAPEHHESAVAINLSARQLESTDLPSIVRASLADFGTDPAKVSFEITETVLLHDVEPVVETLHELRDLGVHLSLDDFGTGYSSLTYLTRLPIDVVKVDRSFVSQLGTGSRDASIVEMVMTMARTLDLHVVAEGVETEEQAEVLRGWGCPFAQGYLFARPMPVGELT
jgi:diguanylate cyclase (GGDEF)-like protein/PAS domain S-box-containing protein